MITEWKINETMTRMETLDNSKNINEEERQERMGLDTTLEWLETWAILEHELKYWAVGGHYLTVENCFESLDIDIMSEPVRADIEEQILKFLESRGIKKSSTVKHIIENATDERKLEIIEENNLTATDLIVNKEQFANYLHQHQAEIDLEKMFQKIF